jgi:DNA invertase Pin-like site-specific DNA recombinase
VFADKPGAVSHEAQTTAIRELAARHGYQLRDQDILEDWGRSGGAGKEKHRPGYLTLRAAVTDGTVSDVFAYDLSRLTRSLVEWASLAEACARSGVRVHLVTEGTFDFGSVSGEMVANILASVAQAVRGWATERAVQTVAYRRRRGDRLGPPAYGHEFVRRKDSAIVGGADDPAAVVAAFRESGSYQRAAKLLNERGIPSKRADRGGIWRALAVRRVIEREAPELIPRNARPGARTRQSTYLASLLRCPCGGILTPSRRAGRDTVAYRCQRAYTDPAHSRPASVPEVAVLPLVRSEVARLLPPDVVQLGRNNAAARSALAERRSRLALAFTRGAVDEPTWSAEDAIIAAELDGLTDAEALAAVPLVDWTWEPDSVNAVLRALFDRIQLGPDFRPLPYPDGFIWTVPEWRGLSAPAGADRGIAASLAMPARLEASR